MKKFNLKKNVNEQIKMFLQQDKIRHFKQKVKDKKYIHETTKNLSELFIG